MTTIGEDIIALVEAADIGGHHYRRMFEYFTPADQGAYDNRPLTMIASEARSSQEADVTVDASRSTLNLLFAGQYNAQGQARVYEFASEVYRFFRNDGDLPACLLDREVNGSFYHCIRAMHPPSHDGFDSDGRTVYSFELEIYKSGPGE
jgi:hypothetical protein